MTFPWNENAERRLAELASERGPTEIAVILTKEFGCSVGEAAVRAKRDKLRLPVAKDKSPWTPERTDLARKMWAEGKSAAEIAKAIGGISRNAVISKMYRSEVGVRPKARAQPPKMGRPKKTAIEAGFASVAARKANEARKTVKLGRLAASNGIAQAHPLAPPEAVPMDPWKWDSRPLPDSRPGLLVDLESDQCRWPLEEQDGIRGRHVMCGAKQRPGCKYCDAHLRRGLTAEGYARMRERERAKAA